MDKLPCDCVYLNNLYGDNDVDCYPMMYCPHCQATTCTSATLYNDLEDPKAYCIVCDGELEELT